MRKRSSTVRLGLVCLVVLGLLTGTAQTADARTSAAPKVTSLTATAGPSTGGTKVTVKGSNFSHVVSVTVGGSKAKSLHVSATHTSLTFTTPAHVIGRADVRVKTSAGTSPVTVKDRFTYRLYSSVGAGGFHSCAVSSGAVRCWGDDNEGELGNNTIVAHSESPVSVLGLSHVVALALSYFLSCALRSDGTVRCWGRNSDGQLGNNSTTRSPVPVKVVGLSDVVEISAGGSHVCAVIADGTVRCWGLNTYGELGNRSTTSSPKPVAVKGISHVTSIATAFESTCAASSDGATRCWGGNSNGQLGNGTISDSKTPVRVIGVSKAMSLGAGEETVCAVIAGGEVRCWGKGGEGQLGNGTASDSYAAVTVAGISGATSVVGGVFHVCALVASHAFCWGYDSFDQIGDGLEGGDSQLTPAAVAQQGTAVGLSAGAYHSCLMLSAGAIRCWGYNEDAELGSGPLTQSPIPVPAG